MPKNGRRFALSLTLGSQREREQHISSLSNTPARGKEGVAEGELRNLERSARSARITYSGGYAYLDDSR